MDQLRYIETTLRSLIEELKDNNCIGQDFEFLTEAEQNQVIESFIDSFLEEDHIPGIERVDGPLPTPRGAP